MTGLKILVFVAIFVMAFISCSKERPAADKNSPNVNETASAEVLQSPEVHTIEIKQMKFNPAEIRVKKGDEVRWINKDITDHDITEQSSKAWASSPLSTGESWSMVATETVDYYCNLHQVMKGKIIVE
jgi:plastocyanin